MIDIKLIRENPDLVRENIKKKFKDEKLGIVDKIVKIDEQWKKAKQEEETLRAERNKLSKQVNQLMKSGKKSEAEKVIKSAKKIPSEIEKLEEKRRDYEEKMQSLISAVPNIISERVPLGKDDSENVVEKVYGKPEKFSFPIKSHAEIAERLGLADFDSSARVAGTGFYYLEGDLALLNQALIRFAIDKMVSRNFTYVETPLILKNEVINRVTDLNDQNMMIYRIGNDDTSLIGTSEHSLIGRFVDIEIDSKKLPLKQTSYSMCFRKEIGSHGIDEKGLFRTHQFNKVEMIVICLPEESEKFFEELKSITVEIFKELEIPTRVLKICSGDLGDLKYEQIDVEVYSPRRGKYIEAGSCSNLTSAQARKLGISTRVKGERIVPHTLNNTAIATSRALVAILENNQQKDGSVKVPKVLQKYMGGKKFIQ
ncbi:MAG: serine--tRNA ligase [Nanoarchaeota archaeon]|nr:serine--tRNA ligase [Nanoarchaeota archaeon]